MISKQVAIPMAKPTEQTATSAVAEKPAVQPAAPKTSPLRGGLDFDAGLPTAAPAATGNGWVSDLLRRASTEDASTTVPRQKANGETLNTLSSDIAKSIEHQDAVRLWERHQRGERNIFTREMYTPSGRQTFDDISIKYSSESRFKESVDRYIADFERLIADVSKNDRDNIMTQTYLTSDTGKVYTMLAHAAGRFS